MGRISIKKCHRKNYFLTITLMEKEDYLLKGERFIRVNLEMVRLKAREFARIRRKKFLALIS